MVPLLITLPIWFIICFLVFIFGGNVAGLIAAFV